MLQLSFLGHFGAARPQDRTMQKCFAKKTLTYEMAALLVAAATGRASELGARQCVVVLDEGGNLKAFGRMDGAPLLGIEACQRKAYTALFGVATLELGTSIKNDPALLAGISQLSRVTVLGGGLPLYVDGELVGGIGVGGGTVEQDVGCAAVAAAMLTGV
jgi:uncharacterized protein GlcG (DUF336 family)